MKISRSSDHLMLITPSLPTTWPHAIGMTAGRSSARFMFMQWRRWTRQASGQTRTPPTVRPRLSRCCHACQWDSSSWHGHVARSLSRSPVIHPTTHPSIHTACLTIGTNRQIVGPSLRAGTDQPPCFSSRLPRQAREAGNAGLRSTRMTASMLASPARHMLILSLFVWSLVPWLGIVCFLSDRASLTSLALSVNLWSTTQKTRLAQEFRAADRTRDEASDQR